MKAAGIPMTLPYKTPLLQSKERYPLTLKVHTPANATAGATITTTIHSYADNTKTDSAVVSATVPTEAPTAYHGDGGGGGALQSHSYCNARDNTDTYYDLHARSNVYFNTCTRDYICTNLYAISYAQIKGNTGI